MSINHLPRFHVAGPLALGATLVLDAATLRHMQALRLHPGDHVTLFNGDGTEHVAELIDLAKRGAVVQVRSGAVVDREAPVPVVLAQGICAADRMDLLIQKATELGVTRIIPVISARTVVRLSTERQERREAHWQNVAIAACEQCGRNTIPEVASSIRFDAFMAEMPTTDLRLMLDPAGAVRLRDLPPPASVLVAVGPEGGFTGDERMLLADRGFSAVRFGPRVLRTETAPLAVMAAMQAMWGDA